MRLKDSLSIELQSGHAYLFWFYMPIKTHTNIKFEEDLMKILTGFTKYWFLTVFLLATLILASGCGDDDDEMSDGDTPDGDTPDGDDPDGDDPDGDDPDGDDPDGDEPGDTTSIRALHLSPDAPAVDILVNGALRAVEDLEFPDGTDYLDVPAGTYTFDIVPADGEIGDSVLNIADLDLMADTYYTAVAYDELGSIKALALVDDLSDTDMGMIRVRAIHTAAGVGQVDIWNIPETGDPAIIYENVDFGVAGDYLDLPAGAYTLGFDVDDDATPDLVFETPDLAEGSILNVFAVNDGTQVFLLAQFADGTTASINATPAPANIRALHLSPDAPAVDVYVNGTIKAFSDLSFGDFSSFAELDPGDYDLDITAKDDTVANAVLSVDGASLASGVYYTAVAFNELASIQPLLLESNYSDTAMGEIRVRAIHTAVDVGQVDIWNIPETGDPAIIYENVDFGVAGGYLDLPAGAYTLGFDVDDDATPDLIFETPDLAEGTILDIFAVRDDSDNVFLWAVPMSGDAVRIDPSAI